MKFIAAALILCLTSTAIIYMGVKFDNGWVIAAGIIYLLCTSIHTDDKKE
jgi:hypothetical protein